MTVTPCTTMSLPVSRTSRAIARVRGEASCRIFRWSSKGAWWGRRGGRGRRASAEEEAMRRGGPCRLLYLAFKPLTSGFSSRLFPTRPVHPPTPPPAPPSSPLPPPPSPLSLLHPPCLLLLLLRRCRRWRCRGTLRRRRHNRAQAERHRRGRLVHGHGSNMAEAIGKGPETSGRNVAGASARNQ